ncbi:Myb/SANT-like domain [Sesbania bispinosa]|nr:Myb/SANT-like domain [Sesbania bispinosa]
MDNVVNSDSVEEGNCDDPMECMDHIDLEEDQYDTSGLSLDMAILNHARGELEIRQQVGSLILLCLVAHALYLLQLLPTCLRRGVTELTPNREERRRQLMSYLVQTERMTKGKGQSSNPPQAVREMWRWTEEMDHVMLSQFTEEQNKGHRVGGSWLPVAYANVVNALRSAGVSDVTKQHIKNRMKTCNAKFAEAMFEAKEEDWEDFIRDKPQAAKWKTLQIRHYDLLRGLFGSDRAARRKAATGRQAHSSLDKETIDLNDVGEDTFMNEQGDTHVDDHQNSTPNVESYSPANAPTSQSTGTSGSRGTKRKAPMIDLVETQMKKLIAGIGLVADALSNGNAMYAFNYLVLGLYQMAGSSRSKRGASKVSKDCTNESSKAKCKKSKHTPYQSELKGSLDYTRFFTNDKQMDTYLTGFQGRNLVEPRFMSVDFIRSKGFQFQELLEYQGLNHFVSIQCPYLQELFEGENIELTNIRSWENYDRTEAVKGVIKQGLQPPNKVNAGSLNVEDRLLHYTFARILIPCGSNYAELTEEDIFVLSAMKKRILINWPLYIGQHMHKVKARKMTDLPYAMLITKMFDHYGVDTGKEGEGICWSHRFDQAILNKMKIRQVEGVWQYANEIGFERDN